MRSTRVLIMTAVVALMWPPVAVAFPAGGAITLPFGASYSAPGDGECVHRGVDVACTVGEQVEAPVAGEVTFAGRVPAMTGGGTVLAVSIRSDGDVFTMLPLAAVEVEQGMTLAAGDAVGSAAGVGDASSDSPHLHVGRKRNGVYLDPASVLALPTAPDAPTGDVVEADPAAVNIVPASAAVPQAHPVALEPAAVEAAPAVVSVSEVSVVSESQKVGSDVASARAVQIPSAQPLAVPMVGRPVGAATIAPGVTIARHRATGPAQTEPTPFPSAGSLARRFLVALPSVAATPAGLTCIAVAYMAVTLLLSLRVIERRLQSNLPVSDRFGSMLQHLRAGDTLCGLTSCSGLLPSQSRGRLAQRR